MTATAILTLALLTTVGLQETVEERISAFAAPLAEDGFLSGTLVVVHDGKTVFRESYGLADHEQGVPNESETRSCIASISKPMTALAVAHLAHQERLGLSDPVSTWIDDFPSGDDITLMHLLNHTAGVPHRVTVPNEEIAPTTPEEMVQRVREKGLLYEPGMGNTYSSAGYTVLARIIELATEKSYDEAMRELVFEPLGMSSTSHPDGKMLLPRRARSYLHGPDGLENAPLKDLSFLAGGGSLHSTADDVARFGVACLRREGLPDEVFTIFVDQLGWMRSSVVRWNGITNSYGACLDLHRGEGLVVAFTGNNAFGGIESMRRGAAAIVLGQPVEIPPRLSRTRKPKSELVEYLARYGEDTAPLRFRDGFLYSDRIGLLFPLPDGRFFSGYYGCEVVFQRDEAGAVSAVEYLPAGGGSLVFPRVPD